MTVIEEVVAKNWCTGCGMCAAVCPTKRLEICWNEQGEYNPVVVDAAVKCGKKCSLCYQVCPAHGDTRNETEIATALYGDIDNITHTHETGYQASSYVGYSDLHRLSSASGGLATWVLESLLLTNEVDAVVAVGRSSNAEKLFEFKICKSVEHIRACSRSAYYPVETSQVIEHILNNDGAYAIIGLPCVCKAVRLAQDKIPKLRSRIKYVLGLTCGHSCSKFFAEYICALGGGNPHQLKEFIFRTKDLSQPAHNHGMTFRTGEGESEVSKQILWADGVGDAFTGGFFQLRGCFQCDDIFSECADAVFMDAWLPDYYKQPEGNSIVLLRDPKIVQLISEGLEQETIKVDRVSIFDVIECQKAVLKRKRVRIINEKSGVILRNKLLTHPKLSERFQSFLVHWSCTVSSLIWIRSNKSLKWHKCIIPLPFIGRMMRFFRRVDSFVWRHLNKQ